MNTQTVSLPSVAIARLVAAVASLSGVKFAGVTYRSKESNELARHTFILGASYANTVKASIDGITSLYGATLGADMVSTRHLQKAVKATLAGSPERKASNLALKLFQESIGAERAAASELCISLYDSLAANAVGEQNEAYTKAGMYETICEGLKVSRIDGTFELCGLSHAKKVLEVGTYEAVNSSAKTIAKDKLRKALPIGKYRTLSLDVGALESVRISGAEIDVAE